MLEDGRTHGSHSWGIMFSEFPFCGRSVVRPSSMSAEEEPVFHVRSPVGSAFNAASLGAAVGLVVSAVQNSLQKHHSGAMGVFSRTGRTIAMFCTLRS